MLKNVDIQEILKKRNLSNFESVLLKGYFSKKNFVVKNEVIEKLRILTEDDKRFYCSKDVFKLLGYKKDETFRFTNRREKILKKFVYPDFRGSFARIKELSFITENEFLSILQRSRTKSKEELKEIKDNLIQQDLLKDAFVLEDTKERGFIELLIDVLEPFGFTISRQYPVLRYRIDAYIHDLNIAIEYDENGHAGYSHESHELRQEKIEEYLGCEFIRVSDKNDHAYNVGLVLKKMWEIR